MNQTLKLLRLLGSPFALTTVSTLNQIESKTLCLTSKRNRIFFLYLETMNEKNEADFSALYREENIRYMKIGEAIARASQVLTGAHIQYAFFKTIRPYKSTTVDLDILIFEKRNNFIKSVNTMQKAGYKLVTRGPKSTTLWDQEANIGIDLYEQVAVSYITYIDKQKLIGYITTNKLPNGEYVKTLKPEADLACIIAHSIIKEQMYTLSEYYTFIYYLKQMNTSNFLKFVKQNNMTVATKTHIAITALLHKVAHKAIPKKLQRLLNALGEENFETNRLIKKGLETPFKYHPITIVKSLLEISKENEIKKSIGSQLIHMLNPNVSRDFLEKVVNHIKRETY